MLSVVVEDEAPDPADVGFLRPRAVVAGSDLGPNPVEEPGCSTVWLSGLGHEFPLGGGARGESSHRLATPA
jgi:hypothetical protein